MGLPGAVDFGDYFDNLSSWYVHRDDGNARQHTKRFESRRLIMDSATRTELEAAVFRRLPGTR